MLIRFVISYTSKVASISGKFIAVKNIGDLYFQPLQNVPGSSGLYNCLQCTKRVKVCLCCFEENIFYYIIVQSCSDLESNKHTLR